MSDKLIQQHQLGLGDVLTIEANYQQLSDAQLIAAGANKLNLTRVRESLKNGECFYCSPQVKQPLVGYSTVQESLYLSKLGMSVADSGVINSIQSRFPSVLEATDPTPLGQGNQKQAYIPPAPPTHNFNGNNLGDGEPSSKLWLSLYFYEESAHDTSTQPVAGVPYKLLLDNSLIAEGTTPENGLVEWESIRPNKIYDLYWGLPNTTEYLHSKYVPLMRKHPIKIEKHGEIYDVLYFVNHGSALVLTETAHHTVIKEATKLGDAAATLVQEKTTEITQEQKDKVVLAQKKVRETLAVYTTQGGEDEAPLDAQKPTLVEAYSIAKSQLLLVSIDTLDKANQAQGNSKIYYLEEQTTTTKNSDGTSTSTTKTSSKKKPIALKEALTTAPLVRDALKPFRKIPDKEETDSKADKESEESITGSLDAKKLRQAWEPVKTAIAADWQLGEIKKSGQIPSKMLAKAIAPAWMMAFFDDKTTDAIDKFVKKINQAAQARWRQYEQRREALVIDLEEDKDKITSPDEWAKIQREVKDIWWAGWEELPEADVKAATAEGPYQEFAQSIVKASAPENKREQLKVAEDLAKAPLPPVMWDASMGAQILRYSMGATLKTDFNILETGRLGIEASAKAKANLIEAKAEGNFFLPNSNGHPLKFELPIRTKEGVWEPLTIDGKPYGILAPGPHFAFDKSIVSPKGLFELGESIMGWAIKAQAAQNNYLSSRDKPLKIQVVGHTDAVGNEGYNKKLSVRRATAACALLQNDIKGWLSLFAPRPDDNKVWGDYEVELMVTTVMCIQHWKLSLDWHQVETVDDIKTQLHNGTPLKQTFAQVWQWATGETLRDLFTPPADLLAFLAADLSTKITLFQQHSPSSFLQSIPFLQQWAIQVDGNYSPKTENGLRTLSRLASSYLQVTRKAVEQALPQAIIFTNLSFMTNEVKGLGESQLAIDTTDRSRANRRIELIPYAVVEDISKLERRRTTFGDIRLTVNGCVSGEAGANINLAANLNFNVDKNLLKIGGLVAAATGENVKLSGSASSEIKPAQQQSKETTITGNKASSKTGQALEKVDANAGAKFAAFAGAKAEGGIKAAIDWRRPKADNNADDNKQNQLAPATAAPRKTINKFVTLGDVGFTATALAGIGLDGEFKVGFDPDSRRFQLKIKGELAIGPGGGGSLSFSVALEHMFDFATMVYGKLSDNDFHLIDVFEKVDSYGEELDVYNLFCAWSYEMLKRGHILTAGATYAAGSALQGMVEILDVYDDVLDDWKESQTEIDNLDKLIATVNQDPPMLAYNTPEVNGRLLYRLWRAKADRTGKTWFEHQMLEIKRMFSGEFLVVAADNIQGDWHKSIEDAALLVISKGVKSQREWQKTLQYMGTFNKKGEFCSPVTKPEPGKPECIDDKIARSLANEQRIENELFSDPEDLKTFRSHLKTLPSGEASR